MSTTNNNNISSSTSSKTSEINLRSDHYHYENDDDEDDGIIINSNNATKYDTFLPRPRTILHYLSFEADIDTYETIDGGHSEGNMTTVNNNNNSNSSSSSSPIQGMCNDVMHLIFFVVEERDTHIHPSWCFQASVFLIDMPIGFFLLHNILYLLPFYVPYSSSSFY